MTDRAWPELVKSGSDEGWKLVWEKVVEPESKSQRSAGMMKRYSLSAGDLMGMLYEEMIGRGKIDLYRGDGGSFEGWLKRYVRGYVLNAKPPSHDDVSIDAAGGRDDESPGVEVPVEDHEVVRKEVWHLTHLCFKDLWNDDPEKALVLLLKTRFFLSSDEVRDMLEISSSANVDQIFSRAVKFMRKDWVFRDKTGYN